MKESGFGKKYKKLWCNVSFFDQYIFYGGLDVLRYRKFASRVLTNKTCVQLHTLPQTSDAATFHSQRTQLQMQSWMNKEKLNPSEWGWKLHNERLVPIKCSKSAAPSKLLNVIRCNCKTNCDTRRCTCRKNGLECSSACGECKRNSCSNSNMDIDE